ncbi:DNA helicase [Streptomyces phage Satis]|nr:DNA helicase [Streptomyces phage Satis]QBZ72022.1 DNA helicase [Streptomyces phage Kradal]
MKTLRPYQVETRDILAGGGINASGLGAGKTVTSVEAVRELRLGRMPRILVVAPVNTLRQWERTFNEQFPTLVEKQLTHVVGTHRKDQENWARMTGRAKQPGVFIIGWNAMHGGIPEDIRRRASSGRNATRKEPKATKASAMKAIREGTVPPWTRTGTWDLVILDESHRMVNRDGVPRHVLKCIKTDRWLLLSATPGGNKPEGLWTPLNLVWPSRYPTFWGWVEDNFEIIEDEFYKGGEKSTVRKIGREKRAGAIWEGIPAVVRYRTEDVVADLPPVISREVRISMAPEQEEQYRDFEKQCLAWLSEQPVATPLPIEQRIRLRQAALGTLKAEEVVKRKVSWVTEQGLFGLKADREVFDLKELDRKTEEDGKRKIQVSYAREHLDISYEEDAAQPKLAAVKEILADLPPEETLLVWTHSAKWARMAEKALGAQAVAWTMKTTAAKRRKIEDGFGKDWRVLVAQLQSLSEGVDWLKDVCRCEVIASPSEDNVMNEQAEGRLHRPGQTSPVQRWTLVSEETIDDEVNVNNLIKRARMGSLYKDDAEKEKI